MRQLMKRKRRSNKDVDRVEDGGRAIAIEEGISALVFDYPHDHAYLAGVVHVDYGILRTIKHLTRHLEVSECSEHQWQDAILQGFSVWRQLQRTGQGVVVRRPRGQDSYLRATFWLDALRTYVDSAAAH
jgi:hypothetical protein